MFFSKRWLQVIALSVVTLLAAGCSAGDGSSSSSGGAGSFCMSIEWPDGSERSGDLSRVIPVGSSTCEITITGDELTNPVVRSISFPSTTILVDGLPIGNKVATIKALDASSNIMAQRRESFEILNAQTVTSDHVPLGIAIKGDAGNPSLEPTFINVPYGTNLYFQNWTTTAFTCTVLKNTVTASNIPIAASSQDSNGKWTFPEGSVLPLEDTTYSIAGFPLVAGIARSPVTNYNCDFIKTDNYNWPWQVVFDSAGNAYVSDARNNLIKKYNSNWGFITSWGSGYLNCPYGLSFDSQGLLYVVDRNNRRIVKYDSVGTNKGTWGSQGSGNLQFEGPVSIVINSSDHVFVCDFTNKRVSKFNSAGGFLSKWGSGDTAAAGLSFPHGIGIDKDGMIYVVDVNCKSIKKYDSVGNYLTKFDQDRGVSEVAIDKSGNMYISQNTRILKLDSLGNIVTTFGSAGTGADNFNEVREMTVDAAGNIYTCDITNNRIQRIVPIQ